MRPEAGATTEASVNNRHHKHERGVSDNGVAYTDDEDASTGFDDGEVNRDMEQELKAAALKPKEEGEESVYDGKDMLGRRRGWG
mmetsp:Transcript_47564/g.101068  ORF Transcript_47564/g.101068 Transcript_47564/m.101068 type:complete len:84 (+) Transcript_47564:520-771(+)